MRLKNAIQKQNAENPPEFEEIKNKKYGNTLMYIEERIPMNLLKAVLAEEERRKERK